MKAGSFSTAIVAGLVSLSIGVMIAAGAISTQHPRKLLAIVLVVGGLLGSRPFLRRGQLARLYSAFALMALNTAVMLLVLEAAATIANATLDSLQPRESVPPEIAEVGMTEVERSLYVGWMTRPFMGSAITISRDGLRETRPLARVAASGDNPRPIRVFAFGGSTMWGEGAADDQTIAAHVQSILSERTGHPVLVTNFGQRAWVSTQSVVKLLLELQKGNVPDVVLFYDGYNEVYAAYATGSVGVPERFVQEDNLLGWIKSLAAKTDTVILLKRMLQPGRDAASSDREVQVSPQEIVEAYRRNYLMVGALAEKFGFERLFYWQPQLVTGKKPLALEEQDILEHHKWLPQPVRSLTKSTYAEVAALSLTHGDLVDLSDALDSVVERVYIDPCHVNGRGNSYIADAMVERGLLRVVRARIASHEASR